MTSQVIVPKGGGSKKSPYDPDYARSKLSSKLSEASETFASIPKDASPDEKVVAILTMHPRYISKSDSPKNLLRAAGLEAVGSRSRRVQPEEWGIKKHPDTAITDDLFVVGTRSAFIDWNKQLVEDRVQPTFTETITHIEDLRAFLPKDKLRGIPTDKEEALFEFVLHNVGDARLVDAFIAYATNHGADVLSNRKRSVRGLSFIPLRAKVERVSELAEFTLVRVARGMPTLRPIPATILRNHSSFSITLPTEPALEANRRAVIFDGGLSIPAQKALAPWVRYIEPAGIGPATQLGQWHGLGVTSAFLFGPLSLNHPPQVPFCSVDHVRVLDQRTGANGDIECLDVLDRILKVLDGGTKYDFANLSLGPRVAMDDDDINSWTAELDQRFAGGEIVTTVAAGNDGDKDAASGLNRVQPPGDGVNVLSVGASDCMEASWKRAPYSCVGPGRSPGVMKPDGVAFGGHLPDIPFLILEDSLKSGVTDGTSFAAPSVLRSAAAIGVQAGSKINALSIRALLIHRADRSSHIGSDVGWGQFEVDPMKLITCDDDEVLVLYQDILPVGQHLRAPIPLPTGLLGGALTLSATLVISPAVDPEHPGAYTRAGLEVSLRPHSEKFSVDDAGKRSQHPRTVSFFSASNVYSAAEYSFREGGHKWEPCIRNSKRFLAKSLKEPCFDIYYHQREGGGKVDEPAQPIPYALVVSVKAPKVKDFYNRVVRTYAGILLPIQPQVRIPIQSQRPTP